MTLPGRAEWLYSANTSPVFLIARALMINLTDQAVFEQIGIPVR